MKSNAVVLCASLGLWLALPLQGAVPDPIFQLTLDNNLTDSSGAAPPHNATFQGGAKFDTNAPTIVPGDASGLFNGTDSVIAVSPAGDLTMGGGASFSFAAWIRTDFTDAQRIIFARSTTNFAPNGQYKTAALYLGGGQSGGAATMIYDVYYVGAVSSSVTIPLGVWTHVAMTYDAGTCRLYVNGVPAGQGGIGTINEGDNGEEPWEFTIGATRNPDFPGGRVGIPGGVFKGNIDEVRCWNVALSDADVLSVYQSVGPLITIEQQPLDVSVATGSTATFSLQATLSGVPTGTVLHYQWQTNGVDVVGATSPSYTTPPLTAMQNGLKFRCVLSAPGAQTATSSEATLAVVETVLPSAALAWLGFNNNLNDQAGGTLPHNGSLVNPNNQAKYTNDVVTVTAGSASLSLPGDGSYVDVSNPSNLNVGTGHPFTMTAWIKTTAPGVIVAKSTSGWTSGGDGTHTTALFVNEAGRLVYDVYWQGAVTSAAIVNSGHWTHVAVTYDGAAYRLYVNGSSSGANGFGGDNEGANGESAWQFTIGATLNTDFPRPSGIDGAPFQGVVDEVAFWTVDLPPNQILSVMNQGVPKVAVSITEQPQDLLIPSGGTATFKVTATAVGTSTPLKYQWQLNGKDVANATNSSYVTPPLTTVDNGAIYRCLVSTGPVSNTSREAVVTVLDTSSGYPQAVLADHPLVYYRFDEVSGKTAYDATTNKFNGTYANVGHAAGASAALGRAGTFNGKNTSVAVPALAIDGSTAFNQLTIEVWVKVNTFQNPDGFDCLYNHDGWSSGSLHMHVNPGNRWEFSVNGTAPTDQYVGDPAQPGLLITNQWYHLVAVYDADASSLLRYVNGQLVTNITYDATVPIDLGAAHLGAWNGNSRYYNGSIDELAIYATTLSADRITAHYQAAAISVVGPAISLALAADKLTLSWSGQGFKLQQTSDLMDPAGWTDVPGGGASPVIITVTTRNQYFRLKKP